MSLPPGTQREVEDLYARYGRLLDDGPLIEWPELFTESCLYRIVPRDNHDAGLPLAIMHCESRGMLLDRVRSVAETIMHEPRYLRHLISNVTGSAGTDSELTLTANYLVVEVLPDDLPKILSVGRYLDVAVRDADGALRFRDKCVVYDSVLVPNTIVYPL